VGGQEFRLRMNFHGGSQIDIYRGLKPFGLTMEHVNVIFAGELYHSHKAKEWIARQKAAEGG
jgi:hypothetical protein